MTLPFDANTSVKTTENLNKYKDLEIEVERMWGLKTTTVPGALGTLQEGHGKLHQQNPWQHQHK